jgi:hypothetical protein
MMKINSKQAVIFVFSLSMLQVVVISPRALANDVENGNLLQGQNAQMEARKARKADRQANIQELESDRQANMEDRVETRQAASCGRVALVSAGYVQNFGDRRSTFGQNFGDRMTAFEDRRDNNDAKLNDAREKQDERRNEMYMRLEGISNTDVRQAATKVFKKTVEQAVNDRRSAVDDTLDTFRKEVDALVASKKTSVTGSVDTFQTNVQTAFEKAKLDCAGGTDPKIVRDTLSASLKDARTKLQESRQSFEDIGNAIPGLTATKKIAIDKAMQDFKTTMEQARATLKAALQ